MLAACQGKRRVWKECESKAVRRGESGPAQSASKQPVFRVDGLSVDRL